MRSLFSTNVWALLRRNLSAGQLAGYAVANVIGLTVILAGVLFYGDCRHNSGARDSFFSDDYIVISKRVDGIGFTPVTFSDADIAELRGERWVKKVGRFTVSRFALDATVNIGGRGMSTYLFCESVPDEFFDVRPRGWAFSPGRSFVPIVLSKDYLTLYNFGFAIPQGMPQLSEAVIGAVPIRLRIRGGNGETAYFDAAIVGFSSRLNTIAVPQSFMDWANRRFAPPDSVPPRPSRLILGVDRMRAGDMNRFIEAHDYEVAGAGDRTGKISDFLSVVSVVVTANGFVISALALFILLLSIFLLLQKSREKLRCLMLLGYSPREVGRYYERLIVLGNAGITLVAAALALIVRTTWQDNLEEIGLGGASILAFLATALVYVVGITFLNVWIVRRHLRRIWEGR